MADDNQVKIPSYAPSRKPPRRYFNLSRADAELAGCLVGATGGVFAFGSTIFLFFATVNIASKLMQRMVISMAYGADRYAAGLRFVKKFRLSDGSTLPGRYEALFVAGVFGCLLLVMAPYIRLLQKWGLLLNGDEDSKES